jgi:hypothetical protein
MYSFSTIDRITSCVRHCSNCWRCSSKQNKVAHMGGKQEILKVKHGVRFDLKK